MGRWRGCLAVRDGESDEGEVEEMGKGEELKVTWVALCLGRGNIGMLVRYGWMACTCEGYTSTVYVTESIQDGIYLLA